MCWSLTASAAFAAFGLAATAIHLKTRRPPAHTLLFAYFTLMEALQAAQYLVIDDCASLANRALTILGYLHVCFQPLVVNTYIFSGHRGPKDAGIKAMVQRLCIVSGVLSAARLPGLASTLGALLNPAWAGRAPGSGFDWTSAPWPDFPPPAASGLASLCGLEAMCGRRLCSFSGAHHVAWSLPLTPPSYFIPSGFIHFFMFFVPGIIAPGPDWGLRAFIVLFGFVTGPFISLPMSVGKDYLFEWPATWCAYSIGQVVLVLTIEVLKKEWIGGAKKGGRATRGGGASKRR